MGIDAGYKGAEAVIVFHALDGTGDASRYGGEVSWGIIHQKTAKLGEGTRFAPLIPLVSLPFWRYS
jgi:hypothetical protein